MASRTQKVKWNIASSMAAQLVSVACGVIVPQLMIRTYGSELYGAAASVAHFLAYISLVEGGIAGVARAALYKPLAGGNVKAISDVYNEITRFFKVIGCLFIAYTIIIACSFQFIAGNSELDWLFSFGLVTVTSISTLGQYFIGISNSILMQSDQKHYVINILSILTVTINTLCIVALTHFRCSIIVVKLVSSGVYIIRPVIMAIYVKNHYEILPQSRNERSQVLDQKWTGLGQHVAYFLHSNTDVVVLTVLADLKTVAVYSVYNMIVVCIRDLTASFYNGLESLFGNMYAKSEIPDLNKVFGYYETLISGVAITLYSSAAALIVPFVKLYTKGVNDVEYVVPEFALFAILAELVYTLRTPYHYLSNAANRFKQTKAAAYGEAVINIVLSIGLVFRYGITGVAAATLVATLYRSIYYAIYISKHIIRRRLRMYIKRNAVNAISFALIIVIGSKAVNMIGAQNYFKWILCGMVVFVSASIIEIIFNIIFYKEDVSFIIKRTRAGKLIFPDRGS